MLWWGFYSSLWERAKSVIFFPVLFVPDFQAVGVLDKAHLKFYQFTLKKSRAGTFVHIIVCLWWTDTEAERLTDWERREQSCLYTLSSFLFIHKKHRLLICFHFSFVSQTSFSSVWIVILVWIVVFTCTSVFIFMCSSFTKLVFLWVVFWLILFAYVII